MRYQETGELHKDFHGAALMSANYIVKNYGVGALREIMFLTGTGVYREINRRLKAGDSSELIAFKEYFLKRESGKFTLTRQADGRFELLVTECPMEKHLRSMGMEINKNFYLLNKFLNEALCHDTPYELSYEQLGNGVTRERLTLRK
ncbi:MAG: hypothetical protein PHV82_12875 [Victivallaceae bacterium]|nr:hypothetical protein [Victivallaceae bacterium]